MLSVATQYKMHTERLVTVSGLSGQINSHGISEDDSHNSANMLIRNPMHDVMGISNSEARCYISIHNDHYCLEP